MDRQVVRPDRDDHGEGGAVLVTAYLAAMLLFVVPTFQDLYANLGGTLPLRPEGYRFKANFPEASLLVQEADVRMAGVNIGKVSKIENWGLLVDTPGGSGLVPVAELDIPPGSDPRRQFSVGQDLEVVPNADRGLADLDPGQALPPAPWMKSTGILPGSYASSR